MTWPAFWVDDTGDVDVTLSRFQYRDDSPPCPGGERTHHHAQVPVGRFPARRAADGALEVWPVDEFAGDERWPATCAGCDYVFVDEDPTQVTQSPIYRAYDGREWIDWQLPPGAMFHGWWWGEHWGIGADGIALMCVLPPDNPGGDMRGHWWHVDGPARNHGDGMKPNAWQRTGDPKADPPTVSATPSIATGEYHGYLSLIDGRSTLTDPL